MRLLVLINTDFGQLFFQSRSLTELNQGHSTKLQLSMLTQMGSHRVARILLEIQDIALVIGDDHLFIDLNLNNV